MIREICKDEAFLAQKAEKATPEDAQTAADLLESPALLERARVDFRYSAAEGYDSPLE